MGDRNDTSPLERTFAFSSGEVSFLRATNQKSSCYTSQKLQSKTLFDRTY